MTTIKLFKVGTIFNPIRSNCKPSLKHKKITLSYPSRLNAMAIDPSKVALREDKKYTAGQISFCISINHRVSAEVTGENGECIISDNSKRKSLIRHVYLLMKSAIGFTETIRIDVKSERDELNHVGLGSSGAIAGAVASAINELYGKPLSRENLLKYLAQNYGEEVSESEELLSPVQCVGGSIASGLWEGSILVIAGENEVIKTSCLPTDSYSVLIAVPKQIKKFSTKTALKNEVSSMNKFIECGRKNGPAIAYNVFHKVLPAMNSGDLKTIGDVIYNYRLNMGSIENCSFLYPELVNLSRKLSVLKTNGFAEVLSLSSVGPAFFVITSKPMECKEFLEESNMVIYETKLQNEPYVVGMVP